MEKNEIVTVGLISGRHQMPVDGYIFENEIKDVHDYDGFRRRIIDFLEKKVGVEVRNGIGVNQCEPTDVQVFRGKRELHVYVTGLSAVTAELVAACMRNGVKLVLFNYNSSTGEYVPQFFM